VLQLSDVRVEQPQVNSDRLEAAQILRLHQVACRAVSEARARSLSRKLEVHLRHLGSQPLLGLVLVDGSDAYADANAAVALVDEEAAIASDRDAGGAGRGHEKPPFMRKEHFSEASSLGATPSSP